MTRFLVFLCLFSLPVSAIEFEPLGNGFTAFYKQDDPFDQSKKQYMFFTKRSFVFTCDEISFGIKDSHHFDSFSFNAEVALKVDNNDVLKQSGRYSTYQFGSDLVNDDRMYSSRLTTSVIRQMKAGNSLNASGKALSGWDAYKVSLKGFTKAYNAVCKNPKNTSPNPKRTVECNAIDSALIYHGVDVPPEKREQEIKRLKEKLRPYFYNELLMMNERCMDSLK
ncbi:hypothetical protein Q9X97_003721 [Vibrio parahaemolyticus]|nr:hypothetical protein [Vibrio parahaemolyticus]